MKSALLLLVLLPSFAFCQKKVIDVNKDDANPIRDGLFYVVDGVPFSPAKYVEVVSGTPFFDEDFISADLLMSEGGKIKNVPVKIDFLSNEIIYKDSLGNELIATSGIRQVLLHDKASNGEIIFVNSKYVSFNGQQPPEGWYQLIELGNASLYKKIHKTVKESRPYNSATTQQTIHSTNKYFIDALGVFTEIKKPKDLSGLLTDKAKEMDAYITSNKINTKEDAGWQKAVAYYNSLHSK